MNTDSPPLVSIVLPTYNRADMLPHSIKSVLDQTYRNIELIVIDDHSHDTTEKVVKSFSDDRLVYKKNASNLKLPRSLNEGFSISKGAFLSWTSDDNMYAKDAIQKMLEYAQSRQCEFVFADYYHFTESDSATGEPLDPVHVELPEKLQLHVTNQVGGCFLYSREAYSVVGGYDADLFLVEDYDYFIRMSKSFDMCHIAEPLYYFRRHDQSLFVSRFCVVKAADLLVRYKNRLIDKDEAFENTIRFILSRYSMLRNPLLRIGYNVAQNTSYKLTKLCESCIRGYIKRAIGKKLARLLDEYDAGRINFEQARDSISELFMGIIKLEYIE